MQYVASFSKKKSRSRIENEICGYVQTTVSQIKKSIGQFVIFPLFNIRALLMDAPIRTEMKKTWNAHFISIL